MTFDITFIFEGKPRKASVSEEQKIDSLAYYVILKNELLLRYPDPFVFLLAKNHLGYQSLHGEEQILKDLLFNSLFEYLVSIGRIIRPSESPNPLPIPKDSPESA